jgi:hypothetical protein
MSVKRVSIALFVCCVAAVLCFAYIMMFSKNSFRPHSEAHNYLYEVRQAQRSYGAQAAASTSAQGQSTLGMDPRPVSAERQAEIRAMLKQINAVKNIPQHDRPRIGYDNNGVDNMVMPFEAERGPLAVGIFLFCLALIPAAVFLSHPAGTVEERKRNWLRAFYWSIAAWIVISIGLYIYGKEQQRNNASPFRPGERWVDGHRSFPADSSSIARAHAMLAGHK